MAYTYITDILKSKKPSHQPGTSEFLGVTAGNLLEHSRTFWDIRKLVGVLKRDYFTFNLHSE